MGGNELGDAGLQALRQIPTLTYLDLSGRQGTDSNVWTISMTEVGLEAILTLKNLRELRFGCTSIGVGIEGAKFAEVSMMSVTPLWLERMKSLTKLERLKLQGCDRLKDDSVKTLIAMPALRESRSDRHRDYGKGSRGFARGQTERRDLFRPVGSKVGKLPEQLKDSSARRCGLLCRSANRIGKLKLFA